MRIHVTFKDRVGITQEILMLLGARNLNLDAVEMSPPNVYIDAPTLSQAVLDELNHALLLVKGVRAVELVAILPGQRRRLQLEALLAAMSDPVLAVDPDGCVLLANPKLADLYGRDPTGEPLSKLFAAPDLARTLIDKGFRLPMCEVNFKGQDLLLDATPISGGADVLVGGLLPCTRRAVSASGWRPCSATRPKGWRHCWANQRCSKSSSRACTKWQAWMRRC